MKSNDKLYENLINLLKCFKNRPYHLAKYLMDNKALSTSFIKKLSKSTVKNVDMDITFSDISEMDEYFNSILNNKSKDDITLELNQKLNELLSNEDYEEAICVRDYMNTNRIPRIKE